jgi:UDP-N-acetylmuramoyl-L-alanyl-D-glutamate--2,6-diaminopimelate ligase
VMAAVADKVADRLIITNDNPRSEDAATIADHIVSGISTDHSGNYQIILNRAEAIASAISQASSDDWVLIAGKGHETTQQIGSKLLAFSDRVQVQDALGLEL